jgi:hypothetical protein
MALLQYVQMPCHKLLQPHLLLQALLVAVHCLQLLGLLTQQLHLAADFGAQLARLLLLLLQLRQIGVHGR